MPIWTTILRETDDGREVKGVLLYAFYNNAGNYQLTEVKIYQDGMLDCLGKVNLDGLKRQVAQGQICTTLPEGASVSIFPLALFTATGINLYADLGDTHFFGVAEAEFLKEVADEIERLNGRPTTSELCREYYQQWRQKPTEEASEVLKTAYEAIPAHNRAYVLGDMDRKDLPIRAAIYGGKDAEDYQNWFNSEDGAEDE